MPRPSDVATLLLGGRPHSVRLLRRSVNDHWLIAFDSEQFVLRRFGARQDASSIDWEQCLITHLADRAWPVPQAVVAPTVVDGATWLVMRRLPGRQMVASPRTSFERGRALARMHADLSEVNLGQRPGWARSDESARVMHEVIDELPAALRERVPDRADELASKVRVVAERTVAELEARDAAAWTASAVHGDFMPWNLLVRGGRVTGVLDFEKSHLEFHARDLAFATWGGRFEADVVAGYQSVDGAGVPPREDLELLWRATCLAAIERHLSSRLRGVAAGGLGWGVDHLLRPWGG
jgi:homoserine kinase type II